MLAHSPIHPPTLPHYVDSTMLSAFRSCQKKFYWEFIRGLRPRALSGDLHAGGIFADALERFYICIHTFDMSTERALAFAVGLIEESWGDYEPHPKNPKTRDNMIAALADYVATYPPRMDRFQPFVDEGKPTIEFSFAIPLDFAGFPRHPSGDPFIYAGRADAFGRYDKLLAFKDDKTTKGIGDKWSSQWDLRGQFIGYVWAGQVSGIEIDTVVVRGVGILKTEIKQAEAIKQYPRHLVDRWLLTVKHDLTRLRHAWDSGQFDYNLSESCTAYNGCQFASLCVAKDAEPWTSDYEVRHWNPLLKNPLAFNPEAPLIAA